MGNGEATRLAILETAGALFNKQGYKATSISDITQELGMTKGAIYRHFTNKSVLEKEALIHLTQGMIQSLNFKIRAGKDVREKMYAVFDYFAAYAKKQPHQSGCPLLNAAVEVDDTNKELKAVVNNIITIIHGGMVHVLENGKKRGQLKEDLDSAKFGWIIFSALEGAIMVTKITDNSQHMLNVTEHLRSEFDKVLI